MVIIIIKFAGCVWVFKCPLQMMSTGIVHDVCLSTNNEVSHQRRKSVEGRRNNILNVQSNRHVSDLASTSTVIQYCLIEIIEKNITF